MHLGGSLQVALRFLEREARTQTIRTWTGLSDDRIRNFYRSYMSRGAQQDFALSSEVDSAAPAHLGGAAITIELFRQIEQRRRYPTFVAELVADLPPDLVFLTGGIQRRAGVEVTDYLRLVVRLLIQLAGLGHGH
jgi:hypothetical protein